MKNFIILFAVFVFITNCANDGEFLTADDLEITYSQCQDGEDNDGDGLTDCEEVDCQGWDICPGGGGDSDADGDADVGTWEDPETGLTWENPPSPILMTPNEGEQYCENLYANGYPDWRLPTIDELRTLIVDCPEMEPGGDCPISDPDQLEWNTEIANNCHCDGDLNHLTSNLDGPQWQYWSSSRIEGSESPAWFYINYLAGSFLGMEMYEYSEAFVRCVHN